MSKRYTKFRPLARMIARCTAHYTSRQLRQFENDLTQTRKVQENFLHNWLQANRESDFGRQHHFAAVNSYRDFRRQIPLARYDYFLPYIRRCLQGQPEALLGPGQRLLMFALTSGTTAAAKYIPVTKTFLEHYRRGWNIWGVKAISDHPESYLRKILQVSSPAEEYPSPSGVPCGAISGMLAECQHFIVKRFYALRPEIARISDAQARYYTIMRLALVEDIAFISTANPSTLLTLAQTVQNHAEQLIRDIHDGGLDRTLSLEPDIRLSIQTRLRADHKKARFLEDLLDRQGRLRPCDYWQLSFLANWTGGTLKMYLPALEEYYGQVPIRDIGLLASEGRMSIPFTDNTPEGVLDIKSNFYEFVPEEEIEAALNDDKEETLPAGLTILRADELEAGKNYYIFLTNYTGLCRYHIGDVVRVTGFIKNAPVIEFLSKGANSSSITGEKLTEYQVVNAVNNAGRELHIKMPNYFMAPIWDTLPCYGFYFELENTLSAGMLNKLALAIDRNLSRSNIEYNAKRRSRRLGPVAARQLPAGTISRRDKEIIAANKGRSEQFKHRFLINEPLA